MNGSKKKIILPYAEEVNYWRTSKVSVEGWLARAKKEIVGIGGKVTGEGYLSDVERGRAAILMSFKIEGNEYKATWPVLPTRRNNEADAQAAKVQAATALYHDIKSRVVCAKFRGIVFSFLNYQILGTGQTVSEAADAGSLDQLPLLLQPPRSE